MQEEVYAIQDRSYSAWHRRHSTRRFVGIDRAQLLAMVDLTSRAGEPRRSLTPREWATGLLRIRKWSAKRIDRAANDETY